MVKLYKDGDEIALITDAPSQEFFFDELATMMDRIAKRWENDLYFQFSWMFALIHEIASDLPVKTEVKKEKGDLIKRTLRCASSHKVWPTEDMCTLNSEDALYVAPVTSQSPTHI